MTLQYDVVCALTNSADNVKVGGVAVCGKTSSSSRGAGEWDEILLMSKNAKE